MKRKSCTYNYEDFKTKNSNKVLIILIIFFCLFFMSLFKNISYPLFWADESMTAIGTERVLEFGYPKVHGEKNVFYDLKHSNPKLGIKKENDAYIGGTGWGHYYFGVIGYKIAALTDDIYLKTGLYRATFATIGLIGLALICFFISKFFHDKFTKYAFTTLFLLLELKSISLVLLLREVRYYSLVVFLSCFIIGLYVSFRFYKPKKRILFIFMNSFLLWLLFNTFSPVYFITVLSIGISELVIFIYQYSKSDIKVLFKNSLPVIISLIISLIIVLPLIVYFRTFQISDAISEFNGFNSKMYWNNLSTIFNYFKNFELLLLAILMKLILSFNIKKLLNERIPIFKVSNFMTLFIVVSFFSIAMIPNFIFTRYIIYLQPFLSISIILDFFILLQLYSANSTKLINSKLLSIIIVFIGLYGYTILNNFDHIKGHVYEMNHKYKGPLDFTIPYIQKTFPKTDTLIIAANYEETSYMYYLKCKVIVGYVGNNLNEDIKEHPHIIAYRKSWNNYIELFNRYMKKGNYRPITFPVRDNPVNNIPELNFMPFFNHKYKTLHQRSQNDDDATYLYIRE